MLGRATSADRPAFRLASDLITAVQNPVEISFLKVSSYQGTQSSGKVLEVLGLDMDINHRHVIIVEDIVDTGLTLENIQHKLSQHHPASVETLSLFAKPSCFQTQVHIKYTGFEIPNVFIVGYGMDYDGLGRDLNDVYGLRE